jgi:GntR family transcriptional regulator / MocR family aminotransferase
MIRLDRAQAEPLHEQLYRQIRAELETGSFGGGSWRLPSSRMLAADLGISRFTVKLALERLRSEGYLRSTTGSGTFVAELLPEHFLKARPAEAVLSGIDHAVRVATRVTLLSDKRSAAQLNDGVAGPPGRVLVSGIPAVDEFPMQTWERLRTQILARKGAHLLRYASSRGELDLRKALAAYLCDFRGVRCDPDQVVIVSGMQQAMMVSAMALINPGEIVWIEDPGYFQARNVFKFAGASIIPRPVDSEGLVIKKSSKERSPKIIYVTPSAQFPLGMTMSSDRRQDLIAFARERNAFILEDDYNSEFWFARPPMPSLQGIDNSGHVIYAGTMSKILCPSLRMGYLVVPERFIEAIVKTRSVMDLHSSPVDQATLARFITDGFFLGHVRRIRKLYAERREFFIEQFNAMLKDHFRLHVPEAGLDLIAWLRHPEDFLLICHFFEESEIRPTRLSYYSIKAGLDPAFVFGFAAWTKAQIRQSLLRLAVFLQRNAGGAKKAPAAVPVEVVAERF